MTTVKTATTPQAPSMPLKAAVRMREDLGELRPSTREVLEGYSKIPADKVMDVVYDIRARAFAIHPYPCIGMGRFLDMAIADHTLYPEILARLKGEKQTYLDLGCAFAQDLRRLVADGVDSQQLYASDLRLDFLDLGFELFRDRETLKTTFIEADIFDPKGGLEVLDGKMDIIGASSFFHLFLLEAQKDVARRVIKLLKPKPGSLIVGRQMGSFVPGEYQRSADRPKRYRHSDESWRQMWDEIGAEQGIRFETVVKVGALSKYVTAQEMDELWEKNDTGMIFSVRRL